MVLELQAVQFHVFDFHPFFEDFGGAVEVARLDLMFLKFFVIY